MLGSANGVHSGVRTTDPRRLHWDVGRSDDIVMRRMADIDCEPGWLKVLPRRHRAVALRTPLRRRMVIASGSAFAAAPDVAK